jgi:phosphatidylglycerophosphate synthase
MMPVEKLDTLLLFAGLIVIAPVTSNFIYSYKNSKHKTASQLGHLTTFFSMLVIGMLFVTLDVLLIEMIGNVIMFRLVLALFWIAVVTFDFADFWTLKR